MNVIEQAQKRLYKSGKRVVFTECEEERILKAARTLCDKEVCIPVFYGKPAEIEKAAEKYGIQLEGFKIIDIEDENLREEYAKRYHESVPMYSEKVLLKKLKRPLNGAAILVKIGEADALASGVINSTGDVILAAQQFIGIKEGIQSISSIGFQIAPRFDKTEGLQILGLSDCAVNQKPTVDELAGIAIVSADTYSKVMNEEARVAMLSCSTLGSASGECVDLVKEALEKAKSERPDLLIEGEYQLDTALDPHIAERKVKQENQVAGRANVLIFPDLNAGNIAVKCMQMFGNVGSYGPLLQGFAKPVTDFSRAATVDDVIGNVTLCLTLVEEE